MSRPCEPVHELQPIGRCHWCDLWHRNPAYRELWSGPSPASLPVSGPGTELKALLLEVGASPGENCSCNSRAAQMDKWGPDGCRERREEIIGWLRGEMDRLGWAQRAYLGLRALTAGLVSFTDPVGHLVDLAIQRAEEKLMHTWAYGVTTVPQRMTDLLPRTLESLAGAGFGRPRLFVDRGGRHTSEQYSRFGVPVTIRDGQVGPFLNWWMALAELYGREPDRERYAIFQDDLLAVKNLRAYLDRCAFPANGYWNLFTFLDSDNVVHKPGWVEGPTLNMGQNPGESWQSGRGALGLVFDREGVQALLSSRDFVNKPATHDQPRTRIDGAVVNAMNKAGRREFVHGPSLLYHLGERTSIDEPGKAGKVWQNNARTWPGEDWDTLTEMRKLMAGN